MGDYLDGLGDSVDLVVLGAWHGKGKRSGTYGAFLLGVYDPEEEGYQTTCKIGTGFSDQDLKDHHAYFGPKAQATKPSELTSTRSLNRTFGSSPPRSGSARL